MNLPEIARQRLYNQHISHNSLTTPLEVVRRLGAVQAQDYLGALWAIGLRMKRAVESDIEEALTKGKIVRMWPMRGTLHFVAAEDAHWLSDLLSPRIVRGVALRGEKNFGLNEKTIEHCRKLVIKALRGGKALSRPELYHVLENNGVTTRNSRGLHILGRLALEKLICFGPRSGKQQVFVLFDEWVPKSKKLERADAITQLVVRYFTGHGPAQIQDLAWWSGLPLKDIRQGIGLAGTALKTESVEGKTYYAASNSGETIPTKHCYLLPPFDEYVVGYRDRSAVLEAVHAQHVNPGANGMLSAVVVIEGQIVGTWKRIIKKNSVVITPKPFIKFSAGDKELIQKAGEQYENFILKKVR